MSFFGLTKKDVRQARGLKKNINRKFHIILFYFIFFSHATIITIYFS